MGHPTQKRMWKTWVPLCPETKLFGLHNVCRSVFRYHDPDNEPRDGKYQLEMEKEGQI